MSQFSRAAEAAGCAWPDDGAQDDRVVLGDRAPPRDGAVGQALEAVQPRGEVREDVGDVGVLAAVDEHLVEALVGRVRGGRVAGAQRRR